MHKPSIDLNKSPLSGIHVTEADLRRRAYAFKCKRTELLGSILNRSAGIVEHLLWETPATFSVSGSALTCNWSDDLKQNLEIIDLSLVHVEALKKDCKRWEMHEEDGKQVKGRLVQTMDQHVREMDLKRIAAQLVSMKSIVIEGARHGN